MRALCVALIAMLLASSLALAAAPIQHSKEGVLVWMNTYDPNRDLARAPSVMKMASDVGALSDPEGSGMYVGFMAGMIGSKPDKADNTIKKLLVLRPVDHWAIVRAIAYSGHPDWRGLMTRYGPQMPTRKLMVQRYLDGKLPTPDTPVEEVKTTWKDRANPTKWFAKKDTDEKEIPLAERPETLDMYWGYYFASRSPQPLERMIKMLPWAEERDSVERLTIGSMAKYTIAMNASRDTKLLGQLKTLQAQQTDKKTSKQLGEAIEAAETAEVSPLRKIALGRLEDLKRMGPGSKRDTVWWGKLGQGVISLGCVAAAATGQVALGLPCVLGGAASSAALYYWGTPQ
ncbi:hypothetical protein M2281_000337 [Mesorhizobium soli]|uniref:hypothetical protein n=1 Tax=Pseudaminobacter soli (ex Li et al. 2025) TaxID=1295366 RepID=UPI0024771A44|nr:hypothetical protein [Mesorhizobium soli]MDH6229765.1 hypothetical protein [Mesorhizobium soli]